MMPVIRSAGDAVRSCHSLPRKAVEMEGGPSRVGCRHRIITVITRVETAGSMA
jgi:hypothetical protein